MSIVRRNIMTQEGYVPYCGNWDCRFTPRSYFNGEQFQCPQCGWKSEFEKEFIEEYKTKWGIDK